MNLGLRYSLFKNKKNIPNYVPLFNRQYKQYAFCETPSINNSNSLTFGGWFNAYEDATTYNVPLICGWSQSGNWGSTHILRSYVRFGNGSETGRFEISNILPQNEWMHLVVSYDTQKITLYKNGEIYQQWNSGTINRINNENIFKISSFSEGSLKYASVAACCVFITTKGITINDVKKLYLAKSLNNIDYLQTNTIGAWNMTECYDTTNTFFDGLYNNLSIQNGYQLVKSPWASKNLNIEFV